MVPRASDDDYRMRRVAVVDAVRARRLKKTLTGEGQKFSHQSMGFVEQANGAIEGNHIAYGWYNRLPGQRPDGSFYEFMGTSLKVYAGGGLFSYHEDVFNMQTCVAVVGEWEEAHRG